MRTRPALLAISTSAAVLAALCRVIPLAAQPSPLIFGPKHPPVQTQRFDALAEGPFNRLVIRNVMIIPGHGGPPTGPHDVLIEGNVITDIRSFDPVAAERARAAGQPIDRWKGDRVIEGNGMYVMPGMFDLHHHVRGEEIPLEYTYYLKLAHGVTTTVPASDGRAAQIQKDQAAAERYQKLAPRMFPIWGWGQGTKATREQREDPAEAARIAHRRQLHLGDRRILEHSRAPAGSGERNARARGAQGGDV